MNHFIQLKKNPKAELLLLPLGRIITTFHVKGNKFSSLKAVALLFFLSAIFCYSSEAQITVTSTTDVLNGSDGFCTLREAITNANDDAATFADCASGIGSDIINLPAGTYTLTIPGSGEDANATGDLDFTDIDGLTILGAGPLSTIIQAGTINPVINPGTTDAVDRVFHQSIPADFTLDGVTVRHGMVAGAGFQVGGGSGSTKLRPSPSTTFPSVTISRRARVSSQLVGASRYRLSMVLNSMSPIVRSSITRRQARRICFLRAVA